MHPPDIATIVRGLGAATLAIYGVRWRHHPLTLLKGPPMRPFVLAVLLTFVAAPAYPQVMGTGIPLNQEKEVTPEQREKRRKTEEAYKATIKTIPAAKPVDPWGNMRGSDSSGSGAAKARTAPRKSN